MQIHASCAARDGAAVLLIGPPGTGKSDLLLRLLELGFLLVADDRVELEAGVARPPPALAGLLEVRGIGILHLAHAPPTPVRLAVALGPPGERLPSPAVHEPTGVPLVRIDPAAPSAALRVAVALDCALGLRTLQAGAFA